MAFKHLAHIKTLIIAGFLLTLKMPALQACGPLEAGPQGYAFFRINQHFESETYPQLLENYAGLRQWYAYRNTRQNDENIEEWQLKFCGLPKKEDIKSLIFDATIGSLEELKTSAQSKSIPIPVLLRDNSFAIQLSENKCLETIDYLIFAKRCEPWVSSPDPWESQTDRAPGMQQLIDLGLAAFDKTSSPFIRMRYAFQIIRLAHYRKDYQQTLDLHEFLMPKIDPRVRSIMTYWIMGHKAGALQSLGQNLEAALLYGKIFLHCPGKRDQAFRSFRVKTDQEWETIQLRCDSDSLRAAFFAMRAYSEQSRLMEEMEKIYTLFPQSLFLKPLMNREIKKLEQDFLGLDFNPDKNKNKAAYQIPRPAARQRLEAAITFIEKALAEGKIREPIFWKISLGYLHLLNKDYAKAKGIIQAVKKESKDPQLDAQMEKFEHILTVLHWQVPSEYVENQAYQLLEESSLMAKEPDFQRFLLDKMAYMYQQSGQVGSAYRCQYSLDQLKPNPQRNILNDLLRLSRKTGKNDFERFLVVTQGNNLEPELLDIKATDYLASGQVEAALEIFKEIPRLSWDDYGLFNPFVLRTSECIHCPQSPTTEMLNKGEIMERLIQLEYDSKSKIDNSAPYFFELGLAWYNMSYFGYAYQVLDYYRSGANWYFRNSENVYTTWLFPFGNREQMNLDKALAYFVQATQEAKDPELAAQAAFMAAKCEQKMNYLAPKPSGNPPRIYFRLLKDQYAQTQFYQSIILECKYFQYYAKK